ncbi:MAG: cytochrome d ubiquinol oxidase subunit II [Rhabdochlamydiaceae bacterium]
MLEIFWYFIFIIATIFYMILDGFDLGVGCVHLLARTDLQRRIFLNSIGPVWDGNEVWLVVLVGSLFAGFPPVYASLMSSFYLFVMLFITALIFRAVAIEFRSKEAYAFWRKTWDVIFSLSSAAISFGIGIVLGNLVTGIAVDENHEFIGSFSDFFHPYSVVAGLMTMSLLSMHGLIYLIMKTEGDLQDKMKKWVKISMIIFLFIYSLFTYMTGVYAPYILDKIMIYPYLSVVPVSIFFSVFQIYRLLNKGREGWAFILSSLSILLCISLFVLGTFPVLIRSSLNPDLYSLTIHNSASSTLTLKILAIIVLIGLPFVVGYGIYLYRVFKGKVQIEDSSY